MFLVENTQPNSRSFGPKTIIGPGINKMKPDVWKQVVAVYEKQVRGLESDGIIIIHDEGKVNLALVSKTYDLELLELWLEDAKGPLKGAIKKQIKLVALNNDDDDDETPEV